MCACIILFVCLCVYVCIYVCVCVRACACDYVYIHISIHSHMYLCIYTYILSRTHLLLFSLSPSPTHTNTHTHAQKYTHTHTYTHTHQGLGWETDDEMMEIIKRENDQYIQQLAKLGFCPHFFFRGSPSNTVTHISLNQGYMGSFASANEPMVTLGVCGNSRRICALFEPIISRICRAH